MLKTKNPNKTENHKVTILTMTVIATAFPFSNPWFTKKKVNVPSVNPKPPGNILNEPIMIAKEYIKLAQKNEILGIKLQRII